MTKRAEPAHHLKIVELFTDDGRSVQWLAMEFDMQPNTIRRILKRHGIIYNCFKYKKGYGIHIKGVVYNARGVKKETY